NCTNTSVIFFASCKKDYTCVCTVPSNSSSAYAGMSYTYDLGKIKKKDAKNSCEAAGSQWITLGGTCEEKVK
ncbi:MAG: hypothetical protein V4677_08180, partial [Bacteroidota bacterium]